jgi:integrase/recombinase XerD
MFLSVYTRHSAGCKFAKDRACRRCNCPKWVGGQVNGYYFRQSAKTRQSAQAEACRLRLEEALAKGLSPFGPASSSHQAIGASPVPSPPPAPPPLPSPAEVRAAPRPRMTVAKAVDAYLADAMSRSVESSTLKKLETIFRKQFLVWTRAQGIEYLDEVDLDGLLNFRGTWKDGALAKQKKQSRVIGFFWACVRRRYLTENPAIGLGKIKVVHVPTDYFPSHEFERILAACGRLDQGVKRAYDVEKRGQRILALTQLMRWSGLRIRDAVTMERHRLHGDSLLLYQAKTGTAVYVPLPPHVVEALEDVPPGLKPNPRYLFWSGNGNPKSAVADWQRSYRRLFELADIRTADGEPKRCHPHMFRDTFAVEMLLAGVPIDQVSLLLGHASVKITEKSYAPFVKARQIQLLESVRNAWKLGQPTGRGPEDSPPASSHPKCAGPQPIQTRKQAD